MPFGLWLSAVPLKTRKTSVLKIIPLVVLWQVCPTHAFLHLNEPEFQSGPQRFISIVPEPGREDKAEYPVGTQGRATPEMMCQANSDCRCLFKWNLMITGIYLSFSFLCFYSALGPKRANGFYLSKDHPHPEMAMGHGVRQPLSLSLLSPPLLSCSLSPPIPCVSVSLLSLNFSLPFFLFLCCLSLSLPLPPCFGACVCVCLSGILPSTLCMCASCLSSSSPSLSPLLLSPVAFLQQIQPGSQDTQLLVLALSPTGCVVMANLLYISGPQFLQPQNRLDWMLLQVLTALRLYH